MERSGTSLTFSGNGLADNGRSDCTECSTSRPFQKDAIFRQNLSAQGIRAYAFTESCYQQSGHLHDFQLVPDDQEDWYKEAATSTL